MISKKIYKLDSSLPNMLPGPFSHVLWALGAYWADCCVAIDIR